MAVPAPQRQPASGTPILSGAPSSLDSSQDRRTLAPTALTLFRRERASELTSRHRVMGKGHCWSPRFPIPLACRAYRTGSTALSSAAFRARISGSTIGRFGVK
jgi:hypothetical protein